jgi:hypothetical protein
MSNLIELYKKHINPEPDGAEIHYFHQLFNIGLELQHPDPNIENQRKVNVEMRYGQAEKWIYENSKLKKKKVMNDIQRSIIQDEKCKTLKADQDLYNKCDESIGERMQHYQDIYNKLWIKCSALIEKEILKELLKNHSNGITTLPKEFNKKDNE